MCIQKKSIKLTIIIIQTLQTFDRVTTYPYGTGAFKVCESKMMVKKKVMPIKLYY